MKKKNIAWLLSAAMILTTASAPVETVSVYAAEEFQAETDEAEGTEIASEDSQDNDTSNLELFEDSTEELEKDAEADNSDTEELQTTFQTEKQQLSVRAKVRKLLVVEVLEMEIMLLMNFMRMDDL